MFMQKIEAARVTCDLFAVTKGFDGNGGSAVDRGSKPRTANEAEARAYADFIRRKNDLPELGKAELQHKGGAGRWATSHFHYVGATYGEEISRGEYQEGAFSVLFPGANQMRAPVTFETLDESGDVLTSSTMPVEPKKGGIVWGKDDVRKACGPVAKAKAARTPTPRTRKAAPTMAEQDKRRRAVLMALSLRARLRRARDIAADRLCQIAELTGKAASARQNAEERAKAPDAPATAPDAILSDLAAAERLMRGEVYVAPRPLSMREAFQALYCIARRDKLTGADLLHAACDLTGEPHETFKCWQASRLHIAVTRALETVEPMRRKLALSVLNGWGHGNPYRSPAMDSPRYAGWIRTVRRANALRKRLADAGRLELDAGNWVQRVLPLPVTPEPTPTAIQAECAVNAPCGAVRRTPAHERAIRRAWSERCARREAEADALMWARVAEIRQGKRKAAVAKAMRLARDLATAKQRAIGLEIRNDQVRQSLQGERNAAEDRARLAEQIAEDHLRMREEVQEALRATDARLKAAEAENAQLWAEIEALTAPATPVHERAA